MPNVDLYGQSTVLGIGMAADKKCVASCMGRPVSPSLYHCTLYSILLEPMCGQYSDLKATVTLCEANLSVLGLVNFCS